MKIVIASLLLLAAACSSSDECDLARENLENVRRDDQLGEECSMFSSGGCDETFDTCAEGECRFRSGGTNGRICTHDCTTDSDCTGIGICYDGFCQPGATCETFCDDGGLCCTYRRSDTNPTECVQVSCS